MLAKIGTFAAASVVVIGLAAAPSASGASCGSVNVELGHGSEGGAQNIKATNISCSEARKVARRCVKGTKRSSWSVRHTSTRFILKSGSRKVTYTPVGGGGCSDLMGE